MGLHANQFQTLKLQRPLERSELVMGWVADGICFHIAGIFFEKFEEIWTRVGLLLLANQHQIPNSEHQNSSKFQHQIPNTKTPVGFFVDKMYSLRFFFLLIRRLSALIKSLDLYSNGPEVNVKSIRSSCLHDCSPICVSYFLAFLLSHLGSTVEKSCFVMEVNLQIGGLLW